MFKQHIHRLFSSLPINRTIPRIFIFDSCSGDKDKENQARPEIIKQREQYEAEYGPDSIELMNVDRSTGNKSAYPNTMGDADRDHPTLPRAGTETWASGNCICTVSGSMSVFGVD